MGWKACVALLPEAVLQTWLVLRLDLRVEKTDIVSIAVLILFAPVALAERPEHVLSMGNFSACHVRTRLFKCKSGTD